MIADLFCISFCSTAMLIVIKEIWSLYGKLPYFVFAFSSVVLGAYISVITCAILELLG